MQKKKKKMLVEICEKQTVFDHPILRIEKAKLKVDTFSGEQMEMTRYALDRPAVVAVLLYLTDVEKIVLVEQFRYSSLKTTSGWMLEIVAGMIDEGENSEQAAIRELLEETGYLVEKATKVMQYYPSVGMSNQLIMYYFVKAHSTAKKEHGGGLIQEGENIAVHYFSIDEAKNLLASGKLEDAKTIIALQHFFQNYKEK